MNSLHRMSTGRNRLLMIFARFAECLQLAPLVDSICLPAPVKAARANRAEADHNRRANKQTGKCQPGAARGARPLMRRGGSTVLHVLKHSFACSCTLNQPVSQALHYRKVQPFFVDARAHAVKFVRQTLRCSA